MTDYPYDLDVYPAPCTVTKAINYAVVSYRQGPDGPDHMVLVTSHPHFASEAEAREEIARMRAAEQADVTPYRKSAQMGINDLLAPGAA
jgi:hypothetical protein